MYTQGTRTYTHAEDRRHVHVCVGVYIWRREHVRAARRQGVGSADWLC